MVWCFRSVPKSYLTDNVALSIVLKKIHKPSSPLQHSFQRKQILNSNLNFQESTFPPPTSPQIKSFKPESPPVALVVISPRFLVYSQVGNHGSDCWRYTSNLVKQMVCIRERKNINLLVEYFENKYSFAVEIVMHRFNFKGVENITSNPSIKTWVAALLVPLPVQTD